jgi:hypothetical protein
VVSSAAGDHRFVGSNGGSGAAADWRFTGGSGALTRLISPTGLPSRWLDGSRTSTVVRLGAPRIACSRRRGVER